MPGLASQLPPPAAHLAGWPWTEESSPSLYAAPPPGGWPRISIICPSYNQGGYIEETIRSVLLQNYPELELIVMDGGSRDVTVACLETYARWLTRWESAPDRGQSHALNKAAAHATGELIGWINSDDYYLPGAFVAIARAYRRRGPRLFFGDEEVVEATTGNRRVVRHRPALRFQVAVGGRTLPSHATFWPRRFHQPFDESLQFTLDAEFFKRLASAGLRPCHVPQPLGAFRLHAASKTSNLQAVAQAETTAWSNAQPWHTSFLWRVSRVLDRLTR